MDYILLVEDEVKLQNIIVDYFAAKGEYKIAYVSNGIEALSVFEEQEFAMVLLDVMMPKLDGFSVCKAIRKQSEIPIIFLTAKSDEEDQMLGYAMGADDYITKPFSLGVLYAKVSALMKRAKGTVLQQSIKTNDLQIDLRKMEVTRNNEIIDLAPMEYKLLVYLILNKGQVLTRERFDDEVAQARMDIEKNLMSIQIHYEQLIEEMGESKRLELIEYWKQGEMNHALIGQIGAANTGDSNGYIQGAIYDANQHKWIAHSGECIFFGQSVLVNDDKQNEKELYIQAPLYLRNYLTDQQIQYLEVLEQSKGNIPYIYEVTGYYMDGEIIPSELLIYQVTDLNEYQIKTLEEIEAKTLIQSYEFKIEPTEDMMPFWGVSRYYESNDGKDRKYIETQKVEKDQADRQAIVEDIEKKMGDDHTAGLSESSSHSFELIELQIDRVKINDKIYFLTLYTVHTPLKDAILKMLPVYLFSFLMVIILSVILSVRLWKIYVQQQKLEKGRRMLIDGISHELKIPLSLIRTYSEGIKEKISEEKKDEYLSIIIDETYKMDEMVLEMLELSKLEIGAYPFRMQEINLNKLVEEALEPKQKLIEERGLKIEFSSDQTYLIQADYQKMKQVINNFIINAILHSKANEIIKINIKKNCFSIENKGESLNNNQKEYIWQAFYKGHNGTEDYQKGTGLGLAIVSEILKAHRFKYGVENTAEGVRFWFQFK